MMFTLKCDDNMDTVQCSQDQLESYAQSFVNKVGFNPPEYGVKKYKVVEVYRLYEVNGELLELRKFKEISVQLPCKRMEEEQYSKEIQKLFKGLPEELAALGEFALMNDFSYEDLYEHQLEAMKDAVPKLLKFAEAYTEWQNIGKRHETN